MNHINTKVLAGLAAAAAVAIGAAVLVSHYRQASESSSEAAYVLPDLRQHVNDVKSIAIIVADNKTAVTLDNGDKGWTVREKEGYPADTGKLREMLLKLADARLLQEKTANADRYAELGAEDIKGKEAKGVLIKLEGLAKPVQLIVGNASSHGDGTFVRRPDDKQSWLAQGQLRIEREPAQWLDTALTDIASERIAEIVLNTAQGKLLRLSRNEAGGSLQLADLPKGREPATPDVSAALASTLSGLTLEDVATGKTPPDPSRLVKAHYRTFDGITIDVTAWEQERKHYASFEASLDQAVADKAIQTEQEKAKADYEDRQKAAAKDPKAKEGQAAKPDTSPAPQAVQDPVKHRQQRLDGLNAEVAGLKQRFQGRQFVIPEFKYANLNKTVEDVLKPLSETQKSAAKTKKGRKR